MDIRLRRRMVLLAVVAGVLTAAGVLALSGHLRRRLTPERSVTVTVLYGCGHRRPGGKAGESVISALSARRVGAVFGDWRLAGKSRTLLRLVYERQDLCPRCGRKRFLGVSAGLVAIYAGTPRHRGQVLELTKIRADGLPEPELADLERGISFSTAGERLQILEGLAALLEE